MSRKVYIIDQIEHGNMGVMNHNFLDYLLLKDALKKSPKSYGIISKVWGFWPMICSDKNGKDIIYIWDDELSKWDKP